MCGEVVCVGRWCVCGGGVHEMVLIASSCIHQNSLKVTCKTPQCMVVDNHLIEMVVLTLQRWWYSPHRDGGTHPIEVVVLIP